MLRHAVPRSPAPTRSTPGLLLLQVTCGAAGMLGPFNSSIVTVALPEIRDHFGVGVGALTLLVSGYLIAIAVLQPAAGRCGDAFGDLRVACIGMAFVIGASLLGALAWSFEVVVISRVVQGAALAFVMPTTVAALRRRVPEERLGRALSMNGAALNLGAVTGPLAGGLAFLAGDWRLLFVVSMVPSIIAFVLLLRFAGVKGQGRKALAVDLPSMALLLTFFTGLTSLGAALRLDQPWLLAAAFAATLIGGAGYGAAYARRRRGVIDLRLFTRRNYAAGTAGTALGNLVFYTAFIAFPVIIEEVRGHGHSLSATMLVLVTIPTVLLAPFGGRLVDSPHARSTSLLGSVVLIGGIIALGGSVSHGPVVLLGGALMLVSAGYWFSNIALQASSLAAWPPSMAGMTSGTYSTMRHSGAIVGAALAAAVLGGEPGASDYTRLFLILGVLATLNFAAVYSVRFRGSTTVTATTAPAAQRSA